MPSNEDDLVGFTLPSGIKNVQYGVWRSRCCGEEIVLYRGAIFPICNRHRTGDGVAINFYGSPHQAKRRASRVQAADRRKRC